LIYSKTLIIRLIRPARFSLQRGRQAKPNDFFNLFDLFDLFGLFDLFDLFEESTLTYSKTLLQVQLALIRKTSFNSFFLPTSSTYPKNLFQLNVIRRKTTSFNFSLETTRNFFLLLFTSTPRTTSSFRLLQLHEQLFLFVYFNSTNNFFLFTFTCLRLLQLLFVHIGINFFNSNSPPPRLISLELVVVRYLFEEP